MKFNPKTILLSFIASLVLVQVTAQESDSPKPYRIVISSDFPPLGAIYPRSGFNPEPPGMQEGDTPTFLQLVSAIYGKNDPEKPDQESWGGQYKQRDPDKNHWYDGPGAISVSKWLDDIQADLAKRADWMLPK